MVVSRSRGRLADEPGVRQVTQAHIDPRAGRVIQAGRITDQHAGTDAGLEEQPHHA